jgi:hypothetical protein
LIYKHLYPQMNKSVLITAFFLACFACLPLSGATNDVSSIVVDDEGWSVYTTIDGRDPAGTYAMGWNATNTVASSTPKMVITATSEGFDDNCLPTTIVRTIYGTKQVRKPYPNQAQIDEVDNGATVSVRIALSDYLYADDTSITANVASGLYTQGGSPNNVATALAVTNSSAVTYQKVIGAWNTVPFQKVGASFKLRASAFHRDGREGRPVRAVKFTVTDGTATVTQIVTQQTISNDDGDAKPIPEYIATISTSTFAQGATLTCNFVAYPWVGDASSVLDTSTGTAGPTALHGPITMVCDKNATYGVTYALVDPVTGSDSGAQTVYDSASYNAATAYKFATIAKAAQKIKDYNTTNRSRGDVGAGVIQLVGGNHAWMGASLGAVYGTTPATWITIEPAAGFTAADVLITGASGNKDISDRVRVSRCTITSATVSTFSGIGALWWDRCVFDTANTSLFDPGVHWVTWCQIKKVSQGLRSFSTENTSFAMIRGNDFSGFTGSIHYYNCIGNVKSGITTGSPRLISSINGQNAPPPQSQILAYNEFLGFDQGTDGTTLMHTSVANASNIEAQIGSAMVQNVMERLGTSLLAPLSEFGSATSSGDSRNVLIWHNTLMGQRQNWAYNSTGTLPKYREFWSLKNNIFWDYNIKTDTFAPESGARIGNWSVLYGVGFEGNVIGKNGNGFENEFIGLKTTTLSWTAMTASVYFKVVDYRANDAVNPGTGNGDYTPLATSPAYNLQYTKLLAYDIDGNARGTVDSAGAITTYVDATNTAPVVSITSPANAATVASPVSFTATATDAEDGSLAASVSWSSSVDGAIGTGASISSPLTVGAHTITATVTDAGGASDSDVITITVTGAAASGTLNGNVLNAGAIIIQ